MRRTSLSRQGSSAPKTCALITVLVALACAAALAFWLLAAIPQRAADGGATVSDYACLLYTSSTTEPQALGATQRAGRGGSKLNDASQSSFDCRRAETRDTSRFRVREVEGYIL